MRKKTREKKKKNEKKKNEKKKNTNQKNIQTHKQTQTPPQSKYKEVNNI